MSRRTALAPPPQAAAQERTGAPALPGMARDDALDAMRAAATLLVILIHVGAQGFGRLGERHWWAVNAWESMARVSVPLFFMLTGALLLTRSHTVTALGRRIWRVVLPLAAWSALYLLWFRYAGQQHDNWPALIVAGPVVGHLWYLYALVGAYVFVPVLAAFHQHSTLPIQLFCLLFWFIGATVVPLEVTFTASRVVGVDWAVWPLYAGYMALGALLYHRLPARPGARIRAGAWLAWGVLTAAIALATWWRSVTLGQANETFYVYSSPLVALASVAAFVALRALGTAWVPAGSRRQRAIAWFAATSFGVYLVHVWVLFVLETYGINYRFINPWLGVPALTLLAAALSALLVRTLQAIPVLRAIVPR
jgi:surface polysaccharide O-acyltransferase-like enzyme